MPVEWSTKVCVHIHNTSFTFTFRVRFLFRALKTDVSASSSLHALNFRLPICRPVYQSAVLVLCLVYRMNLRYTCVICGLRYNNIFGSRIEVTFSPFQDYFNQKMWSCGDQTLSAWKEPLTPPSFASDKLSAASFHHSKDIYTFSPTYIWTFKLKSCV